MRHYVLTADRVPKAVTFEEWLADYTPRVAWDLAGASGYAVSTVFLGLAEDPPEGETDPTLPRLFETAVVDTATQTMVTSERVATWSEAVALHRRTVEWWGKETYGGSERQRAGNDLGNEPVGDDGDPVAREHE